MSAVSGPTESSSELSPSSRDAHGRPTGRHRDDEPPGADERDEHRDGGGSARLFRRPAARSRRARGRVDRRRRPGVLLGRRSQGTQHDDGRDVAGSARHLRAGRVPRAPVPRAGHRRGGRLRARRRLRARDSLGLHRRRRHGGVRRPRDDDRALPGDRWHPAPAAHPRHTARQGADFHRTPHEGRRGQGRRAHQSPRARGAGAREGGPDRRDDRQERAHRGSPGEEGHCLRSRDGSRHGHDPGDRGLQRDRCDRGPRRGRARVQREAETRVQGEVTMASIDLSLTDDQRALRAGVLEICKRYPGEYWRDLDTRREYPEKFVTELTGAGYLAALIPQEFGGAGLGILEGGLILETINYSGGNAGACHAQMYIMGTVLRHGSAAQKKEYLPKIATGALRLQAFGVTEPNSGSDTTKLQTTALRKGDRYVVNGQKIFISRVLQSDMMLLLARTTAVGQVKKRTDGLSVFLIDIRNLKGFEVRPLRMMMNHSTNALFFDNVEIPAASLIGQEGRGFSYILDGMNAERILVGSESLGDGRWFVEKAVAYSNQRVIFGKSIGGNQGVQFPIAKSHMAVEAATLMRNKAAALFDAGEPCGPEANMTKYLAAEAAWDAGNACIDCHGGYGYAEEYDVERKFRECRLYKTAPINQNLVMAYVGEHVLGMSRSY